MHLCVLRGSDNRAIISLYSNNLSVFVTEAESLFNSDSVSSLKGSNEGRVALS